MNDLLPGQRVNVDGEQAIVLDADEDVATVRVGARIVDVETWRIEPARRTR